MKTELKPYKHSLYSPHSWPPSVGQIVILLDEPRGYVGVLDRIEGIYGYVRFLDSTEELIQTDLMSLLATGKTPQDLITQYELTPQEFSTGLANERTFPDFSRTKTTRKGGVKKKKKPKVLTEANKMYLAGLIKAALSKKGVK